MDLRKLLLSGAFISVLFLIPPSVQAITVNELYGTWEGTFTPLPNPPPLFLTSSGITPLVPPDGFFEPRPLTFTFSPSAVFEFDWQFGLEPPPGVQVVLNRELTAAHVNGNTVTWDGVVQTLLADGTYSDAATEHYTVTIGPDPANAGQFAMTGLVTELPSVQALASNTTVNVFVVDRSLSLTKPVPEPGALLLLGVGGLLSLRRSRHPDRRMPF